jgi:RNA polymerase sigma-70 factor (ECF subfamily)
MEQQIRAENDLAKESAPALARANVSAAADDARDIAKFLNSNQPEDLQGLFSRHMPSVHSMAWRLTGSASAADDVTQEVFVKIIQGLKGFRNQSSFSTWLYRVTLNSSHTWFAKKETATKRYFQVDRLDGQIADHATAQPLNRLVQQELVTQIEAAISSLKPDLKAAIVLTALENLSSAQAAEIAQCSVEAFYSRLHLARQQLKQQLKRYLES